MLQFSIVFNYITKDKFCQNRLIKLNLVSTNNKRLSNTVSITQPPIWIIFHFAFLIQTSKERFSGPCF